MDLTKSRVHNVICGIEIDASSVPVPAPVGSLQPFFNTHIASNNAKPVYFGNKTVRIGQAGKQTRAGMLYEHSLRIMFPNGDLFSANRIEEYRKAKAIYIKLSGGVQLHFGRNDYLQNKFPEFKTESDENMTSVSYSCESMFPMGQTNGSFDHLFPEDLPINFFTI
ncbi:hypothetical protein [Altibacter sp. HG106]|uniref:hypothetical protein n=1 Tax=Altibacter sp. HG106 TaxID=3023937 RepID=UPI0023509D12|nr:hypothetical protein [Altibacter sp. HG106]MDC7994445.1 hypothetical protein [Altibacter sp. HG106]